MRGGGGLHPRAVPAHGGRHGRLAAAGRAPLAPPHRQPEAGVRLRAGAGHHGHPQDVSTRGRAPIVINRGCSLAGACDNIPHQYIVLVSKQNDDYSVTVSED